MLLRYILSLLMCGLGVILLNLFTHGLLDSFMEPIPLLDWNEVVFKFLSSLLFKDNISGLPFSIALSLLSVIAFIIYEYNFTFKNIDTYEIITYFKLSASYLIASIVIFQILLGYIYFILFLSELGYLFLFNIPYERGWLYVTDYRYFNNPNIYFENIRNDSPIKGFILGIIYSVIYLFTIVLIFYRTSKFSSIYHTNQRKLFFAHRILKLLSNVYIVYVSPVVFAWMYPILLYWFGRITKPSDLYNTNWFVHNILTILIMLSIVGVIYKLITYNRSIFFADFKEEIKRELREN
jgi:hypothetical protein